MDCGPSDLELGNPALHGSKQYPNMVGVEELLSLAVSLLLTCMQLNGGLHNVTAANQFIRHCVVPHMSSAG